MLLAAACPGRAAAAAAPGRAGPRSRSPSTMHGAELQLIGADGLTFSPRNYKSLADAEIVPSGCFNEGRYADFLKPASGLLSGCRCSRDRVSGNACKGLGEGGNPLDFGRARARSRCD